MKPRQLFRFVEEREDEVNVMWMILHIIIFILTAVNSVVAAYAVGEIYDIFNYRCVLYAKPNFVLKSIRMITTVPDVSTPSVTGTDPGLSNTSQNVVKLTNPPTLPVPSIENIYIMDEEFHFENKTLTGKIALTMKGTVFSSSMMCDLVMFLPMFSMIVALAFAFIVFLCGRGGRSTSAEIVTYSWLYVYPVFFASFIMIILSIVAANQINSGLDKFCSHFEKFTGTIKCSYFINFFTKQQKAGFRDVWIYILYCFVTYTLNVFLWIGQTVLTFLRILMSADFKLEATLIKSKVEDDNSDDEELVWETRSYKLYETVMQVRQLRPTRSDETVV